MRLGQVVMTRGVADLDIPVLDLLLRHAAGDWGDVCPEDWQLNDQAVEHGDRVLSSYIVGGTKLWIITEWDRSVTTILLPGEY